MTRTQNALYDCIVGLSAVTTYLGTYRGKVAVFARSPIPSSVDVTKQKYVVIRDAISDTEGVGETKTSRGRLVVHDIGVYAPADGYPAIVQDVAEAIRDYFTVTRPAVTVSGYGDALIVKAYGPIEADEDLVYGRIVTVSLDLVKA